MGIVIGTGTCDSPEKKSLSFTADMQAMEADAIGEIEVDEGLPLANSIALALPITGKNVMESVAAYLRGLQRDESGRGISTTDEKMASRLKEMVQNGSFMLTESDFVLGESLPGPAFSAGRQGVASRP
jgi:hypothetical protein